jgi:branched-chain amino acid transport system substrate-binding protein
MRNKRRNISIIVFVIILISLFLTLFTASPQKYKIGVILPMSGNFAFYGERSLEGLQLAHQDFPEFELIVENDEGDSSKAVSAATKLITLDNVDALITIRSSISAAVASVAENHGVVLLYSSSIDQPAEENYHVFKNFLNIGKDCEELATLLKNKTGRLLGHNLDSTSTCISSFEKNGFALEPELFQKGEFDFRTSLTKIKYDEPDFLILRGDENILPTILRQMKELNIKDIQIICPHITGGGCNSPELISNYSEFYNSFLGSDIYVTNTEEIERFRATFKEHFNTEPIDLSYALYEDGMILFNTIISCRGSKECMIDRLLSSTFDGLDGELQFNDKGIIERRVNIVEFDSQQGRFVSI